MSEHDVACRMLPEHLLNGCNIVLFEDDSTAQDLFPLSVLRPSWEIRCGAGCLRQWLIGLDMPSMSLLFRPRAELRKMAEQLAGQEEDAFDPAANAVFINGRLIGLWNTLPEPPELPSTIVDQDGRILIARRSAAEARSLLALSGNELAANLVQKQKGMELPAGWTMIHARYIWDYMRHNSRALERQLISEIKAASEMLGAHTLRELPAGAHVTDRTAGHPVYVGSGVKIMPGAVFGNHAGPIWIGSRTEIEPHTYLEGPLYIGHDCRIKMGGRFYQGCALGPHCRVAGEISASVMQGYVNKQHDGFLGNSILGQWVNLGADTVTSNLKNDYSHVKVRIGDIRVDTGDQFIGLMCGDHTKTGINTMFNTGTVVGVAANVYGGDYPPRFINSFSWGNAEGMKTGDLDRTLRAARFAMQRRNVELSAAEEELLRRHYADTSNQERSK